MSALGEYAMKAVAAGVAIVKLRKFLEDTDDQHLELTREEVEAIMMTIREQAQALKREKR